MMGHRDLPMRNGDECDVFSAWRRVARWTHKAGSCRRVKRGYARRVRATMRRELARGVQ